MPDKTYNRTKHLLWLILPFLLFLIDQWTKFLVNTHLHYFQAKKVLGNFLRITLLYNPSGAFGSKIFPPTFYFWFALIVAIGIIIWYIFRFSGIHLFRIGILFVLAGALGNLFDRIRIDKVIDWIDISIGKFNWPVFNLADVYVTVGLILIFISSFLEDKKAKEKAKAEEREEKRKTVETPVNPEVSQ